MDVFVLAGRCLSPGERVFSTFGPDASVLGVRVGVGGAGGVLEVDGISGDGLSGDGGAAEAGGLFGTGGGRAGGVGDVVECRGAGV